MFYVFTCDKIITLSLVMNYWDPNFAPFFIQWWHSCLTASKRPTETISINWTISTLLHHNISIIQNKVAHICWKCSKLPEIYIFKRLFCKQLREINWTKAIPHKRVLLWKKLICFCLQIHLGISKTSAYKFVLYMEICLSQFCSVIFNKGMW
jgi:hypothetical protein